MVGGLERGINILLVVGLFLALFIQIFFPRLEPEESVAGLWSNVRLVLGNKKLLLTGLVAGLMIGPLEGFSDGWGNAFMQAVHVLDRSSANVVISAIFSGTCVSCIILPYLADRMRSYYGITLFSAISMGLAFIYLITGSGNIAVLSSVCFTIGLFCSYQTVMIAKMVSLVPGRLSGLAGSIANMLIMAFGPLFHQAIGLCMDRSWNGTVYEGVRVYHKQAYLNAITLLPVSMLLAAVGLIWLIFTERRREARNFLPLTGAKSQGQ